MCHEDNCRLYRSTSITDENPTSFFCDVRAIQSTHVHGTSSKPMYGGLAILILIDDEYLLRGQAEV